MIFIVKTSLSVLAIYSCMAGTSLANYAVDQRLVPALRRVPDGGYSSPDGRFMVNITLEQNEERSLVIYRLIRKEGRVVRKDIVSRKIHQINGFSWVPRRSHTLVFAAGGDYGKPMLSFWTEDGFRSLHQIKDTQGDYFELIGVTEDGHEIVYVYASFSENPSPRQRAEEIRDLRRHRRMRLPEGAHNTSRSWR